MRNAFFSLMLASLVLVGCGNSAGAPVTGTPVTGTSVTVSSPPQILVQIGGEQILPVVNGYEWSSGGHGTVADAASDPAKDLTKYYAVTGGEVNLSFGHRPTMVQLVMWSNGVQISKSTLNSSVFTLPKQAGDYTYEVRARWGRNDANYDFEVICSTDGHR